MNTIVKIKQFSMFMLLVSVAPSTFGMEAEPQAIGDPAKECLICTQARSLFLECPKCKQTFCKECAENWIGAAFSFSTNYQGNQNLHHSSVVNNSCPFCKQEISREELQKQLSSLSPSATLAEPKTPTEILVAKAKRGGEFFNIITGTISGTDIPAIVLDDVTFAIIDDEDVFRQLALDIRNGNLIILSNLSIATNLTLKAQNLYLLGDIYAGTSANFALSEKMVLCGIDIEVDGEISMPPEERQIMGCSNSTARLEFVRQFREAFKERNRQNLVSLLQFLLAYDGNNFHSSIEAKDDRT